MYNIFYLLRAPPLGLLLISKNSCVCEGNFYFGVNVENKYIQNPIMKFYFKKLSHQN